MTFLTEQNATSSTLQDERFQFLIADLLRSLSPEQIADLERKAKAEQNSPRWLTLLATFLPTLSRIKQ